MWLHYHICIINAQVQKASYAKHDDLPRHLSLKEILIAQGDLG